MFDWLTPDVVEILIGVLKAVVILLVTVVTAALLSFVERAFIGMVARPLRP
jgi:NADH-quinone oxidoreductase subunit H